MSISAVHRVAAVALMIAFSPVASLHANAAEHAALSIETCPEARVCYREIEWAGESERAGRPEGQPVATMKVHEPLSLEGIDLDPGNYAWLFPSGAKETPTLELRRLELPEGVWTEDPLQARGIATDALFRAPLRFDASEGVAPRLTFQLTPGSEGVRLSVRYGNGRFDSLLSRRDGR